MVVVPRLSQEFLVRFGKEDEREKTEEPPPPPPPPARPPPAAAQPSGDAPVREEQRTVTYAAPAGPARPPPGFEPGA